MKHDNAPTNTSPWGEQIYDSYGQLATPREEASDGVFLAINQTGRRAGHGRCQRR